MRGTLSGPAVRTAGGRLPPLQERDTIVGADSIRPGKELIRFGGALSGPASPCQLPLKGELMPAGRTSSVSPARSAFPKGEGFLAALASAAKRKADTAENGGECHKTSACIPICAVI